MRTVTEIIVIYFPNYGSLINDDHTICRVFVIIYIFQHQVEFLCHLELGIQSATWRSAAKASFEAGRHIIGKPVVLLIDVRAAEEAEKPIMKAGTTVYVTNEVLASCLRKLPDSA